MWITSPSFLILKKLLPTSAPNNNLPTIMPLMRSLEPSRHSGYHQKKERLWKSFQALSRKRGRCRIDVSCIPANSSRSWSAVSVSVVLLAADGSSKVPFSNRLWYTQNPSASQLKSLSWLRRLLMKIKTSPLNKGSCICCFTRPPSPSKDLRISATPWYKKYRRLSGRDNISIINKAA